MTGDETATVPQHGMAGVFSTVEAQAHAAVGRAASHELDNFVCGTSQPFVWPHVDVNLYAATKTFILHVFSVSLFLECSGQRAN